MDQMQESPKKPSSMAPRSSGATRDNRMEKPRGCNFTKGDTNGNSLPSSRRFEGVKSRSWRPCGQASPSAHWRPSQKWVGGPTGWTHSQKSEA